jgi:hypothetical protein
MTKTRKYILKLCNLDSMVPSPYGQRHFVRLVSCFFNRWFRRSLRAHNKSKRPIVPEYDAAQFTPTPDRQTLLNLFDNQSLRNVNNERFPFFPFICNSLCRKTEFLMHRHGYVTLKILANFTHKLYPAIPIKPESCWWIFSTHCTIAFYCLSLHYHTKRRRNCQIMNVPTMKNIHSQILWIIQCKIDRCVILYIGLSDYQ